jgi:murein DD-endopeptidase MepM/ murein hydrolase activator NlpD
MLAVLVLVLPACARGPRVISEFGPAYGAEGHLRRDSPHNGIDVAGFVGESVLATADGVIAYAYDSREACGITVKIYHVTHGFQSIYCHLQKLLTSEGNDVRRGEIIGPLGRTGQAPGQDFEHVHLTVRHGPYIDPMTIMDGCFDPQKTYPTDRFVLTFPVQCKN